MVESTPEAGTPEAVGQEVGAVISYFAHVGAAVVDVAKGSLKLGDTIWIKGHTTDFKQAVDSMQIDHKPVTEAKRGDQVGLQVSERVRRHDRVYKL